MVNLCPKKFLVKIRLGSVIILRIRERSSRENCDRAYSMLQHELSFKDLATDFLLGGVSGAVSETLTAPIERVRLVFQTQNVIPQIRNGQVPRYTGIGNCFSRIYSEQVAAAFWRVNFTNCIRLFFFRRKPSICPSRIRSRLCSRLQHEAGFRHVLLCEHGFLWSGSSGEFYDRVSSGLRPNVPFFGCWLGNETFDGLFVCLQKTAAGPKGFFSLYAVFGVSLGKSSRTVASSSVPSTPSWASTRGSTTPACLLRLNVCDGTDSHHLGAGIHNRVGRIFGILHAVLVDIPSFSTLRAWPSARRSPPCSSRQHLPTLRSRSPCASWAPSLSGVCAGSANGSPRTAPFCP